MILVVSIVLIIVASMAFIIFRMTGDDSRTQNLGFSKTIRETIATQKAAEEKRAREKAAREKAEREKAAREKKAKDPCEWIKHLRRS